LAPYGQLRTRQVEMQYRTTGVRGCGA
jgi:hypothetical protein